MDPMLPQAGTIAAVTARAVGVPALAVAQARKRGPQGTAFGETSASYVRMKEEKSENARAPVKVRKEAP
jgi:hypothetical protein